MGLLSFPICTESQVKIILCLCPCKGKYMYVAHKLHFFSRDWGFILTLKKSDQFFRNAKLKLL